MLHGIRSRPLSQTLKLEITHLLNVFACILLLVAALPVNAKAQTAHFSFATLGLGSVNNVAGAVAVDGSGNVFVADGVVQEILAVGGYQTVNTLGLGSGLYSGFNALGAVAVDGSGNVFIIDDVGGGNYEVKEILAAGGYTTVKTLVSGSYFGGVAVDGSGNVFVTVPEVGGAEVQEILAASGYTTVNTLGSGWCNPIGVAVDGSGNVFVADWTCGVKEILAAGGYTTIKTLITIVDSGLSQPYGVAVDGNETIFVADEGYHLVKEVLAAGGYTTVETVGDSSLSGPGGNGPFGVAVDGSGNVFVANGATGIYSTGAVGFGTVAIGQTSATIPLTFTFDTAGTLGSVAVLDSGVSGLDFVAASGGTCTAGEYYSAGNTCTVDVIFKPEFAGLQNGSVVLKNAGGTVIASAYVHGTGSGPSAATTTTFETAPALVTLGNATTLAASVSSTTAATITGGVIFSVGNTSLGTAPVSGGLAVLSNVTVSTVNGFSVGSDMITATYGGDANFAASSGSATLTVVPAQPVTPSYTLTAGAPTATVTAGSSGTVALTLSSTNYAGTVSFATTVSSTNGTASSVSVSAPSVTLTAGGNGTSTLTITTTTSAASHTPAIPWKSSGGVLFCAVLLGTPFTLRWKRAIALLLTALAISLAGFLISCGGGSSSTTTKAARTYMVTVTPTGTGTVTNPAAVSVTVTVQ